MELPNTTFSPTRKIHPEKHPLYLGNRTLSSNIKKYIFSQKNAVLIYQETDTPKKLYFRKCKH